MGSGALKVTFIVGFSFSFCTSVDFHSIQTVETLTRPVISSMLHVQSARAIQAALFFSIILGFTFVPEIAFLIS